MLDQWVSKIFSAFLPSIFSINQEGSTELMLFDKVWERKSKSFVQYDNCKI